MLLSITTDHRPATDLGFLLHKHPQRFQIFNLSFGDAHVFYPEAGDERCTACLLLDVDPVGIVRRRQSMHDSLLSQYVNDRPFVASSLMSVAISQVFGSAMQGRCNDRPELASMRIPLSARLDVLPVRGGAGFLQRVFEPLGYQIEATRQPLDEQFPEWGERPPTMSPCETSQQAGLLEHPAEAFAYYRGQGCPQVVCEEKHMGSRAVVIVCRDADAARRRFGVKEDETGIVYTRTGRRFFNAPELEHEFLDRIRAALAAARFWETFDTTWACLDCELMPWSAKAQELLRSQYAAVGAAGRASLPRAVEALAQARERLNGDSLDGLAPVLASYRDRAESIEKFVSAYRQYCWPVQSLTDLKLAPFHLLATEGRLHISQPHTWHIETLAALSREDPQLLLATPHKLIDVTDPDSEQAGTAWWTELTERGGEGMVVKPLDFIFRGRKGLVQPAVKCRGPEYLRIIYGPDYNAEHNLSRLRARGLGPKRSLAMREFALGVEALERFVRREPLRRVHECVFGVLALESEPVDPRL